MAIPTPEGYRAFSEDTLAPYLADIDAVARRLGGGPGDWRVNEVGDGNLNLVFIVEGPGGSVCVKQALPYVRLVGESWPLPLERAFFEYRASIVQARHAQAWMPEIFHYDDKLYLVVMERLSPHIIMRRGMIEAIEYPHFADHITDYMARTLYFTSDMAMPAAEKKKEIATFCGNIELCRITEDLIFTDPYMVHERNRWTSPQLDDIAARIRDDAPLKRAISALKLKFISEAQALLHGDLHTGSIMITRDETKVIDPEFAFFGPIGFDVGKLIGNFLLCYFSQAGHEPVPGERDAYRRWVLATVEQLWHGFANKFIGLWDANPTGDAYPSPLFEGEQGRSSLRLAQHAYMRQLFTDVVGFAGASMIRRTLGLAHNLDMEAIEDPDRRAACERLNLELACNLLKNAADIPTIEDVTAKAGALYASTR